MESIIEKIQDKLTAITYRLEIHEETNENQFKSFNEMSNAFISSNKLTEKFIEKFEYIDQKFININLELECLNTEIRTIKILIETINIKIEAL